MEDIPEEVYREKYLKYKKKYLELCQTAGAEGLAAGTKQEQINAKKVELNEQFAAELAASQETLEALYSGANDEQKLAIRKVLASIFGSTGFEGVDEIQGKLPAAIDAILSERKDLTDIIIDTFYKTDLGKESKLDDAVLKKYVIEVFTVDNIFKKIVEGYVNKFAMETWNNYKFRKGMNSNQESSFSAGDNNALTLLNKQIELDATCEGMGLFKGPAACSDTEPNTITAERAPGRPFREAEFKKDFEAVDALLKANKAKVLEIENQVVAAQNEYNAKKAALAAAHEVWLTMLNKKAKELGADHKSDDTLDAWTKNKPKVQAFLDEKSCKEQSITVNGTCDYKNIIKALKERHTKKEYDENTDSFQKSVGKGNIKL